VAKGIVIKGLPRLMKNLRRIPTVALNAGASEIESIASEIQTTAANLAPVDTGDLADSVTVDGRRSARSVSYAVQTGEEYARFVEYGTNDHPADEFMKPAAEQAAQRLEPSAKRIANKLEGIH